MNDLEKRLADWQPAVGGLSADAMLFAAGRASARSGWGRVTWPILSGVAAAACLALTVWVGAERSERLALAEQLQQRRDVIVPHSPSSEPGEDQSASSYATARHVVLERGIEAWPVNRSAGTFLSPRLSDQPILQVGRRDGAIDQ